jgi:hypothetical protein
MIITSFDVGIKNLAYCIVDYKPTEINQFPIYDWNIIDIIDSKDIGKVRIPLCHICKNKGYYYTIDNKPICKTHSKNKLKPEQQEELKRLYTIENTTIYEIAKLAIEKLDLIDFSKSEIIIIENQPHMASLKMKMIAMMLLNYFIIRYIVEKKCNIREVLFINASNKLTVYDGPYIECKLKGQYPRNKFYSKEYCKYIIRHNKKWVDFYNSHKKRDDLADCFLQGVWYLMNNYKPNLNLNLHLSNEEIEDKCENKYIDNEGEIKTDEEETKSKLIKIKLKEQVNGIYGKDKLNEIKKSKTTRSVIVDMNINKYKSLKRAYKPKDGKTNLSLSEIKYLIKKGISINDNNILKSSILFYFDDIETFKLI